MGDIADGMVDGSFDCLTGEYIGEPCGHPRVGRWDHLLKRELKEDSKMPSGQYKGTPMNQLDPEYVREVARCQKHRNIVNYVKEYL